MHHGDAVGEACTLENYCEETANQGYQNYACQCRHFDKSNNYDCNQRKQEYRAHIVIMVDDCLR